MEIIFLFIGIGVGVFVAKLLGRRKEYVGSIVVSKNDGITLFSLELDDNPEIIENKKEVTFRIKIPDDGFELERE